MGEVESEPEQERMEVDVVGADVMGTGVVKTDAMTTDGMTVVWTNGTTADVMGTVEEGAGRKKG